FLRARGAPSLAASGGVASLVFWGDTLNPLPYDYYYYAEYSGSWNPTNEQVMTKVLPPLSGSIPFSWRTPANIISDGTTTHLALLGDSGDLYTHARTPPWETAYPHGLNDVKSDVSPSVIKLPENSADLLVVYVRNDNAICYTYGHDTVYTTPTPIHPN